MSETESCREGALDLRAFVWDVFLVHEAPLVRGYPRKNM